MGDNRGFDTLEWRRCHRSNSSGDWRVEPYQLDGPSSERVGGRDARQELFSGDQLQVCGSGGGNGVLSALIMDNGGLVGVI